MKKQKFLSLFILSLSILLSGCFGTTWTGATALYNRHGMYKKINDYSLLVDINNVLAVDRIFNNSDCVIDIAVFNGDVLLAGHLPSAELLDELRQRLNKVKGYQRLFNKITVKQIASNKIQDAWITTKIRSEILADSSIDPNAFKIVTSDRIVYLMGDVKQDEAEKVVQIARLTDEVETVVKLFRYFTYNPKVVS
jgi:osmotically-inducible protein OsmY